MLKSKKLKKLLVYLLYFSLHHAHQPGSLVQELILLLTQEQ